VLSKPLCAVLQAGKARIATIQAQKDEDVAKLQQIQEAKLAQARKEVRAARYCTGLGWAGLGWAGLGWAGLGWAGPAALQHWQPCAAVCCAVRHCDSNSASAVKPTASLTHCQAPAAPLQVHPCKCTQPRTHPLQAAEAVAAAAEGAPNEGLGVLNAVGIIGGGAMTGLYFVTRQSSDEAQAELSEQLTKEQDAVAKLRDQANEAAAAVAKERQLVEKLKDEARNSALSSK
jgi:hypothetical protein